MTMSPDIGVSDAPAPFIPRPAADAGDQAARLRLIRSRRVGPSTFLRLMAEHGDAQAALGALPKVAADAGVSDYAPCPEAVVAAELRAAKRIGARLLCLGDPDYPVRLTAIADPPPVLWAIGKPALLQRPSLAIVGTRNTSSLGARMARRLAADLGEAGFTIVSGLARGIDTLAHRAALGTGTVAVQAGGLDVVYPAENGDLAQDIARKGLRLSEHPFGLEARAQHFPRRNRIVSGVAQAVIVVEAAARSGSLITARLALDQGREVMAVPGHPMDTRASGGNILIRDGALLVRGAEDVIEALGDPKSADAATGPDTVDGSHSAGAPPSSDGGLEAAILAHLTAQPVPEDQVIRDLGGDARAVGQALAILELAGRIERGPGGMVCLSGG